MSQEQVTRDMEIYAAEAAEAAVREALAAERRVWAQLLGYANHSPTCQYGRRDLAEGCTCGLSEVFAELRSRLP